jgi:hypothetical protein
MAVADLHELKSGASRCLSEQLRFGDAARDSPDDSGASPRHAAKKSAPVDTIRIFVRYTKIAHQKVSACDDWNFGILFPGNLLACRQFCKSWPEKILLIAVVGVMALPLIHPFGPVRRQRSEAPLPDMPRAAISCQNCHSERTEWPFYSRLPGVSWLLERDVADARRHLNLSRWTHYSNEEKRDLLGRIAAVVRSHQMPPARYALLHPQARLSSAEIEEICEWTRLQRHDLRDPGINRTARESSPMPQ